MQRRLGPTKIGIFGLLQPSKWVALQFIKLLKKKFDYMLKRLLYYIIYLLAGKKILKG
jgi:NADH:ubiquinone oxidoreductase subunit H